MSISNMCSKTHGSDFHGLSKQSIDHDQESHDTSQPVHTKERRDKKPELSARHITVECGSCEKESPEWAQRSLQTTEGYRGEEDSEETELPRKASTHGETRKALSKHFTEETYTMLSQVLETDFYDTASVERTDRIIDQIGHHFGTMSVSKIGNGANSTAFIVQVENSRQECILRLFPPSTLQKAYVANSYKLNEDYIGGEWLSVVLDHPNLAGNTHIIAYDPQADTFEILDQEQVQKLFDSPEILGNGKELIAVGTIGNYAAGSQDLEKVLEGRKKLFGKELQGILKDLFKGATALGQKKICHRDLKESNVIRIRSGHVKIIDYGTAGIERENGRTSDQTGDRSVHPPESFSDTDRYNKSQDR
ncbi:protein kinase domain-containing protein [Simkania sp.]|uniref:protein kinase domain-containing protein n=1 Tax=Simkania sp. TaxID=34094 RepID=UPI003B51C036